MELVNSLISTSEGPEPVKIKTSLAEEGDITIRGIIIRIFVFGTNRGINELHKEKFGSKDLQYWTLIERATLGEKHLRVSR